MLIYKDFLSGDEMFSDAFAIKKVNDYIWEVEGKFIKVKEGVDDALIGANPSATEGEEALEDGVKTVINVVYSHQLESMDAGTLKDYQLYLRDYLKKVNERIDKRCPAKKADFQKAIMEYFKSKVFGKFKEWDFYRTPNSFPPDQYYIPCNFREDGETPYFVFITEGLDEEKC
ncbi:hypothetical protein Aperf_G00000000589 [Anoplocephala perfoliata]